MNNTATRMHDCKNAALEFFNQLEDKGIKMVGCGVGKNADQTDFIIKIYLHIDEKDNKHGLLSNNKGFQIDYEYMEYPEFA